MENERYLPCIAIALGVIMRRDPRELAEAIRPDYDTVVIPENEYPYNLRGITPFDVQRWLITQGYALAMYDLEPESADGHRIKFEADEAYFQQVLKLGPGILMQPTHAIAWDGKMGIDGFRALDVEKLLTYRICEFFLLVRLPENQHGLL